MKKFGYVIAALATIAVAAPSIASAETVVVRHGGVHHGSAASAGIMAGTTAGTAHTTGWWSSGIAIITITEARHQEVEAKWPREGPFFLDFNPTPGQIRG